MVKVHNRDTLRLLTRRFMKMNRKRNFIAVIAIMLTALLFTSLFTGAQSLILSRRATEIRQFMCSSHAFVQDLTVEKSQKARITLEKDENVSRFGRGIFLGSGMNSEFNFSAEIRFADDNMAESFNCLPTTGRLPKEKNEIAVSSLVLDKLGIPHKLGQILSITWEKDGTDELQTDDFILSGYWKGDKAVISQLLFVSEDYAIANCNNPTETDIENGMFSGAYDYTVWYHNLWNLQAKTDQLSKEAGIHDSANKFEVNPAYDLMEEDSFSYGSLIILLFFIILAGYLIIYNIFSLSVKTDIRAYGLLKNIGTTGKQLKKIVRMQAFRLSVIGIPVGIFAGYIAGVLMSPSLNADSTFNAPEAASSTVVVNADPVVFAVAAVFTLFTVYLSCLQSCHMVEKVSPVEALRLAENDIVPKHGFRCKNSKLSTSWYGMAAKNMLREWRKGFIVMLSVALSMVVINCIVMLVNGYDFDSYRKIFLASDFQIDQMTGTLSTANFKGISPKLQQTLNECPYSEATGYVYYSPEHHGMESSLQKVWERFAEEYKESWSDYENTEWSKLQESGNIKVHFLGISESIFNKLEWKEDPCSWSDFESGNYVIVDYIQYLEEPNSYYQPGDSFDMHYSSGDEKSYTVLGEAKMPYAIDYPYADTLYITVIVPENEFKEHTGIDSAMYATIDAKKGEEKQVQNYLDETVLKKDDMLNVFSILSMRESFQKYVSRYYSIGAFLVVILLCIGSMNFFNTTATSVLSRKRELTLLETVGMTKKQIIKMLIAEGFIYFIGAFLIAVLIICFASEKLLTNTIGKAFFFKMHLTILPCVCMIPLFLIIAIVIPYYQYQKLSRQSIVERIRNACCTLL
ncbi:MAG: ABC transporter permease [Lachnospiraceae bacterium]|nr:ABC transporter permease [Lachnospiraceae bacterium]